ATNKQKELDCFNNVLAKVKSDGGNIQYGWIIWEWPNLFLEAEFHAVWITPDGNYMDITPRQINIPQILFLPDDENIYSGNQVESKFHRLSEKREVKIYIDLMRERFNILNKEKYKNKRKIILDQIDEMLYQNVTTSINATARAMLKIRVAPEEECPCQSGTLYRECCMQLE
ncbi:MAG TPA: SEC-C metal-binding domain-containing protein, partial [Roseiflexaceae bacterium]|nr:SEC-C metal-binding domain-containing protein [Roseiflexaceae bacterium]